MERSTLSELMLTMPFIAKAFPCCTKVRTSHLIQIAPRTMTTETTMAPYPPLSAVSAVSRGTVSPLIHTATSQVTSWSGTIVAIHRRMSARPGVIPWMRTQSGNIVQRPLSARKVYVSTRLKNVFKTDTEYYYRREIRSYVNLIIIRLRQIPKELY